MPSFSNDFKVRETTSLALPRFRAICSCVVESTGEPVPDAFILEISGKALVKPRKEKLAHRPHDFGKMLRCFPVNVVFNVNILIHQSAERAGRSDENFRLLLGLNQNIKADFLHRTGGRQRADFAGTGGKQGNFPLLAGLDKDAELAGEDKQNAETVIVTAVEKNRRADTSSGRKRARVSAAHLR